VVAALEVMPFICELTCVPRSPCAAFTEYLFIKVTKNHRKLLLGVVYKPPDATISHQISIISRILVDYATSYSNVIISGDFNINILADNAHQRDFLDVWSGLGLTVVNSV
jgi:hypothetical protein